MRMKSETFSTSSEMRSNPFAVFLSPEALAINAARLTHLASLGLDISGKSVLEVGAGIGLHTSFFEDLGCSVLCTDGRPENVNEIARRYPHRRTLVLDLDTVEDLSFLGSFDIVYCYGTLYHLTRPEHALAALSVVCREMILLETCVTPGNEKDVHFVCESASPNQSLHGKGCRPTRPWVMEKLRKYFGWAYITRTQPRHPDFDLDWVNPLQKPLHRSVFIGSKTPIDNPLLTEDIPDQQTWEIGHDTTRNLD